MEVKDLKSIFHLLYVEAYDLLYDCKRQAPSLEAALPLFREKFNKRALVVLQSQKIPTEMQSQMIAFYQNQNWWLMGYNEAFKNFDS